jgi:hypothetical protein
MLLLLCAVRCAPLTRCFWGCSQVPASPLPHARTTQYVATSYGGTPVDASYASPGGSKPYLALSPGMSFRPPAAETSVLRSTGPVAHLVASEKAMLGSLGVLQREQEEDETAENEAHARDELQRLAVANDPNDSCFEDDRNAQMALAARTMKSIRRGVEDLSRTLVDGDVEGKDGDADYDDGDVDVDGEDHIIVGEEEAEEEEEYYDEEDDDNVEDVDMGKY